MSKNNYKTIAEFAKSNGIKFCYVDQQTEICPTIDFSMEFIDTDTFEMPCSFMVDRAIVLNIPLPSEMTPDDTGESYDLYWNRITKLREMARPQYIASDGAYIKLMMWCDWSGEVDPKKEFVDTCLEAIKKTITPFDDVHPITRNMLDFRVNVGDVNLEIFEASREGIERMYDFIKDVMDFDCELYVNYCDHAETADHGVRFEKIGKMKFLCAY